MVDGNEEGNATHLSFHEDVNAVDNFTAGSFEVSRARNDQAPSLNVSSLLKIFLRPRTIIWGDNIRPVVRFFVDE